MNNPLAGTDPTGYATSCDGLSASDCKFELASGGASGGSRTYQLDRTSQDNGSERRAGIVGGSERRSASGENGPWRIGGIDGRFGFSKHVEGPNGGSFVPDDSELEESQREFEQVRQAIDDWQKGWREDRPRRNAEAGQIAWRFAGEPIVSAVGLRLLARGLAGLARWSNRGAPDTTAIRSPTEAQLLLAAPKMVKHHIFNVFRGSSPRSQVYRDFFKKHGIDLDKHTVEVSEGVHRQLHAAGNNWTTRWKAWIDANPNATTREVYQQAGRMMDDYGIQHLPIVPY